METIEMLLENYATSINNGDLDLADKFSYKMKILHLSIQEDTK